MKKSFKAALLSALIFPGAGHFFLKKYIAAIIIASIALSSLIYLLSQLVEITQQMITKITSGELRLDADAMTKYLSTEFSNIDTRMQTIALAVLVVSWLVGIIDSYRQGRILKND